MTSFIYQRAELEQGCRKVVIQGCLDHLHLLVQSYHNHTNKSVNDQRVPNWDLLNDGHSDEEL